MGILPLVRTLSYSVQHVQDKQIISFKNIDDQNVDVAYRFGEKCVA